MKETFEIKIKRTEEGNYRILSKLTEGSCWASGALVYSCDVAKWLDKVFATVGRKKIKNFKVTLEEDD